MLTINLTTTSERLTLCAATIWSMVHQVRKPDKIRLWISNEPYLSDKGITTLPEWVIEINNIRNILEVIFVENTGPYRKIIPALRTADQNEVLVYADDDVIYLIGTMGDILSLLVFGRSKKISSVLLKATTCSPYI